MERQLEIVGEAFSQLRKLDAATAGLIQELPHVVGLRNVLIHAYATVDDRLVWGVVEANLAPLVERLKGLLRDA